MNSWDTLYSTISYYITLSESVRYIPYYHLYSVVCVLLEPMSFPKFLIVAQSVLKSLNKLLKSKARMSPKNEIIISIFCISYYPT